jgi:hypothetical protein
MNDAVRALWLAFFILSSLLLGGAAVWLSRSGGADMSGSILAGGSAFCGALLLFMAVYAFMDRNR